MKSEEAKFLAQGFNAYIAKPLSSEKLNDVISSFIKE
jgi:hypothetical protein